MSQTNLKSIAISPRLSEKGYGLSNSRVYVVEADASLNRQTIKAAVEAQFDVSVIKINIINLKGKTKRSITKGGRRVSNGRDKSVKKVYLTLKEGQSLPFYDAIEEEEKKSEQVQEKMAKEIEKQDKPKRRKRKTAKEKE